jgi:hypothetical protein
MVDIGLRYTIRVIRRPLTAGAIKKSNMIFINKNGVRDANSNPAGRDSSHNRFVSNHVVWHLGLGKLGRDGLNDRAVTNPFRGISHRQPQPFRCATDLDADYAFDQDADSNSNSDSLKNAATYSVCLCDAEACV